MYCVVFQISLGHLKERKITFKFNPLKSLMNLVSQSLCQLDVMTSFTFTLWHCVDVDRSAHCAKMCDSVGQGSAFHAMPECVVPSSMSPGKGPVRLAIHSCHQHCHHLHLHHRHCIFMFTWCSLLWCRACCRRMSLASAWSSLPGIHVHMIMDLYHMNMK